MKDNNDLLKELEELSPFLHKMKQEQPQNAFSVPDNYFENLSRDILIRAKAEEASLGAMQVLKTKVEPKRTKWWSFVIHPNFKVGLAASFTLLVAVWALGAWDNKTLVEPTQNNLVAINEDISSDEIYQYVAENIKDFDTDLIYNSSLSNIAETVTTQEVDFQSLEFSDEDLQQYMNEEKILEEDTN